MTGWCKSCDNKKALLHRKVVSYSSTRLPPVVGWLKSQKITILKKYDGTLKRIMIRHRREALKTQNLSLVHTDRVKRSRVGQFNEHVTCAQIENYLSYCVNACDLRRSEQAFKKNKVKIMCSYRFEPKNYGTICREFSTCRVWILIMGGYMDRRVLKW